MNEIKTGNNETATGKITLIIPEVSDLFCMSIRFLVQEMKDVQIVMVLSDCQQIRKFLEASRNCIIVTQCAWLDKLGVCEVEEFLKDYPELKILMYLRPGEYSRAASMFQTGIQGFFSDSITREAFKDCLTVLSSRKSFFSQDIIPAMLSKEADKSNRYSPGMAITGREHEILLLIQQGYTNKEIAAKLCLSPRTIEGHRANLILKFGVRNTAELVSEAMNLLELAS